MFIIIVIGSYFILKWCKIIFPVLFDDELPGSWQDWVKFLAVTWAYWNVNAIVGE